MHFFISHALDQAVKEKRIPENPVRDCILPKKEHTEMKTLPLKDLSAFFDEAKRSGVFELYYTELSTGLRRGELLGIRWTDIDFDASAVYIQRQITRLNGEIKISPLKTKNAYRQILLPAGFITFYLMYWVNPARRLSFFSGLSISQKQCLMKSLNIFRLCSSVLHENSGCHCTAHRKQCPGI